MIKLVKGLQYVYNGQAFLKGQEIRLRSDIEEHLVGTGQFDYVGGAQRTIFIKANTTTTLHLYNYPYEIREGENHEFTSTIGFEIVRLGFGKEIPVRSVVINDMEKLKQTLFIRDGGFGDIIMLYQAFNYLFSEKPELKKIHFMTEERYQDIFKEKDCFELYSLEKYMEILPRFKYVVDLRRSVEGDPNTGDMNRVLLFIRLLGLDINGNGPSFYNQFSRIEFNPQDTKFDNFLIKKSVVINLASSRPERDLSRDTIVDFITKLAGNKDLGNIILIHSIPFKNDFKNDKIKNLTGQTDIKDMLSLIYKAPYYFGLDTGPSHAAGAFNKKGIVVGGPINMDLRFTQYDNLKIVQRTDLDCVITGVCYGCHKRPNPNHPAYCMQYTGQTLYEKFMEAIK